MNKEELIKVFEWFLKKSVRHYDPENVAESIADAYLKDNLEQTDIMIYYKDIDFQLWEVKNSGNWFIAADSKDDALGLANKRAGS